MQLSVRLRNARGGQIETILGTAPLLQIFGGAAMPANCATADAGTKLADDPLPSDWLSAWSSGAASKSGTWTLTGDAIGNARYFRLKNAGDSGCDLQGLCGMAWAASTAWPLGQHVVNDSGKCYVCTTAGTSAGSGGPTGTGSGITDGTAVWSYVGVAIMTLQNTQIAAGQTITVSSFDLTEGGA